MRSELRSEENLATVVAIVVTLWLLAALVLIIWGLVADRAVLYMPGAMMIQGYAVGKFAEKVGFGF